MEEKTLVHMDGLSQSLGTGEALRASRVQIWLLFQGRIGCMSM